MIEIRYNENEITATGHSGYAEREKDIVCASVSTAFRTTAQNLDSLSCKFNIGVDGKIPFIGIQTAKKKGIGPKLLESLLTVLRDLSDEYPDYVKVINHDN